MQDFFTQIFRVAWIVFDTRIPVTSSVSVTPWQIALFAATMGLLLKYLFNKGSEA